MSSNILVLGKFLRSTYRRVGDLNQAHCRNDNHIVAFRVSWFRPQPLVAIRYSRDDITMRLGYVITSLLSYNIS